MRQTKIAMMCSLFFGRKLVNSEIHSSCWIWPQDEVCMCVCAVYRMLPEMVTKSAANWALCAPFAFITDTPTLPCVRVCLAVADLPICSAHHPLIQIETPFERRLAEMFSLLAFLSAFLFCSLSGAVLLFCLISCHILLCVTFLLLHLPSSCNRSVCVPHAHTHVHGVSSVQISFSPTFQCLDGLHILNFLLSTQQCRVISFFSVEGNLHFWPFFSLLEFCSILVRFFFGCTNHRQTNAFLVLSL